MSILKQFEHTLTTKVNSLIEDMASGSLNFEVYKSTAAKINAYRDAVEILKDLVKKSYKDEID